MDQVRVREIIIADVVKILLVVWSEGDIELIKTFI